jgi:hypothetical protein
MLASTENNVAVIDSGQEPELATVFRWATPASPRVPAPAQAKVARGRPGSHVDNGRSIWSLSLQSFVPPQPRTRPLAAHACGMWIAAVRVWTREAVARGLLPAEHEAVCVGDCVPILRRRDRRYAPLLERARTRHCFLVVSGSASRKWSTLSPGVCVFLYGVPISGGWRDKMRAVCAHSPAKPSALVCRRGTSCRLTVWTGALRQCRALRMCLLTLEKDWY